MDITQDEFNRLWDLNPEGNYNYAYSITQNVLAKDPLDNKGIPVDINYIIEKYSKYLEAWDSQWESVEPRFIPKEKQRKSIQDFMALYMYMSEFKIHKKPNDSYLFGDLEKEELQMQLDTFKNLWLNMK